MLVVRPVNHYLIPPLSLGSPNKLKWPPRPRSNSEWHLSGWWQHSWQGTILRDRDTQTVTLWQWPHPGSVYNLYCHQDYYLVTWYYWVLLGQVSSDRDGSHGNSLDGGWPWWRVFCETLKNNKAGVIWIFSQPTADREDNCCDKKMLSC